MRVHIVTIAYAPARILLTCLDQAYRTIGIDVDQHFILNNHYPVNQTQNDDLIEAIVPCFGAHTLDCGINTGLMVGYNHLLKELQADDDDIVIGLDGDCFPVTPGWGKALVDAASHSDIGWTTLANKTADRELQQRGFTPVDVNGIKARIAHHACINSICAWRYDTLKKLGGLHEPKKFYGGIECMMFPMIKRLGKYWIYLSDFYEEYSPLVESEPLYKEYKLEYGYYNRTDLEFSTWLKSKSSP